LYNVLESKEGLARKPNFAEDVTSGRLEGSRVVLEEKEFRLARTVAVGQTSNILTISILLDR